MIYLIPVCVAFFVLFLFSRSDPICYNRSLTEKIITYYFSLSFIFIASLRFKTGTDWEPYYELFHKPYSVIMHHYAEPVYKVIVIAVKTVFNNYSVLLLIISLFFLVELKSLYNISLLFARRSLLVLLLSTYMYRFSDYMGGQRQAIAVALCFLSMSFIIKKKNIVAIILWLMAILSHTSAVLFIFPMIIYKITNSKKPYLVMFFLVMMFLLMIVIYQLILYTEVSFNLLIIYQIIIKAKSYQGYQAVMPTFNYELRDSLLIAERILFNILFFIAMPYYRASKIGQYLVNTYTFSTAFYTFFIFTARNIAGRGIAYFRFADILLLSTLPEALLYKFRRTYSKMVFKKLVEFMIIVYIVLRFIFVVLIANKIFYIPYHSIL